uniref:Protein SPT2 homolog n=1 Tax=Panagrolaimus sp. JU765 TaxID=591449 RepID=A0AC34QT07_9BILA
MSTKPAVSLVSDDMLDLLNDAKTITTKPVPKKPGMVKKPAISKPLKPAPTITNVKPKTNGKTPTSSSSKSGNSSSLVNNKKPSLPPRRLPPPMSSFEEMMKLASQNVQKLQSGDLPTAPPPVSKPFAEASRNMSSNKYKPSEKAVSKKPVVEANRNVKKPVPASANTKTKSDGKAPTGSSSKSGSSSNVIYDKKSSLPPKKQLPPMSHSDKMKKLPTQNGQKLQSGKLSAAPPPVSKSSADMSRNMSSNKYKPFEKSISKKPVVEVNRDVRNPVSTLDRRKSAMETRPSSNKPMVNSRSSMMNSQSSMNSRPSMMDSRSSMNSRPSVMDSRSSMVKSRPPVMSSQYSMNSRSTMMSSRPPMNSRPVMKRRYNDYDDDEYDSMDDFIDDDVNEDYVPRNELNKVLRNFCRSDQDTWRRRERDIDIRGMEAGFRTIEAEDRKSSKIARYEDMLEEQRGARQLK